jgi:tetratricopeptide (TPR) repeat protein
MRKYAEARKTIDEAVKVARAPEILLLDAQLRLLQKDVAGARAAAEEVLKSAPEDISALNILATSYANEKHPELALKRIQDQVVQRPRSARLQHRLALQLSAENKNEEARNALGEALRIDSTFLPAVLEMAKMDIRQRRSDEARKRLTGLIDTNTAEVDARLLLAQLEINLSNPKAAIEQYRQILSRDSNNLVALNNIASLLADDTNGADEALKYAQQLKELAPNESLADDALGWAFYRKGLYTSAVQHLKTAAGREEAPAIKYHLAMAYFKAGDPESARKMLAVALKQSPSVPEAQAAQQLISQH